MTGRFVTRQASDLVRVTFAGGVELVGTHSHPIWSPLHQDWRALGEFEPGDLVQTRTGLIAVQAVEPLAIRPAVYNIEVAGEHVYEVTELGVLVHNNNALCEEIRRLQDLARTGDTAAIRRLEELETLRSGPGGRIFGNAPSTTSPLPTRTRFRELTTGEFELGGETVRVISGGQTPPGAATNIANLSEDARRALTHAEGRAAAIMRANPDMGDGFLRINFETGPCERCLNGIQEILLPGQHLEVTYPLPYGNTGRGVFVGGQGPDAGWFQLASDF